MLATASGDQTIRVWDMRPQQPEAVATLRGHKGSVKAVEFRPHSRNQLVSGARGGDVILWDTRTSSGQAMSVLNVKPVDPKINSRIMTHEEATAWVWEFRSFYRQRSRGNSESESRSRFVLPVS